MSGPASKHPDGRARKNVAVNVVTYLPASGRPGRAPAWPLGDDVEIEVGITIAKLDVKQLTSDLAAAADSRSRHSTRSKLAAAQGRLHKLEALKKYMAAQQRARWNTLWKTPQATRWEALSWTHDVALYVRVLLRAEAGSLDHVKEERLRAKALGLTPDGMKELRWEIVDAAAPDSGPAPKSRRNSSKYRGLKVVS